MATQYDISAETHWVSVHAYTQTDQDALLLEFLSEPSIFVAGRPFFYIRHWLGGAHVRIRLATLPGDPKNFELRLVDALASWLRKRGGPERISEVSDEIKALAALEGIDLAAHAWPATERAATNVPYERETQKFGGVAATVAAERYFHQNSLLVLNWLRNVPTFRRRLVLAARAAFVTAAAFDIPVAKFPSFFYYQAVTWGRYLGPDPKAHIQAFRVAHAKQKPVLDKLWDLFSRDLTCGLPSLYEQMADLRASITHCGGAAARFAAAPQEFYYPLVFLHLTNNRLGIPPAYESYIGSLLALSAEDQ
ncbi:lantibiotic dehydratase C-terminal domain-containing protein [Rhizobium ruizarguesonis]